MLQISRDRGYMVWICLNARVVRVASILGGQLKCVVDSFDSVASCLRMSRGVLFVGTHERLIKHSFWSLYTLGIERKIFDAPPANQYFPNL